MKHHFVHHFYHPYCLPSYPLVKGRTNLKIKEKYLTSGSFSTSRKGNSTSKPLGVSRSNSSLSLYSTASAPSSPLTRKVCYTQPIRSKVLSPLLKQSAIPQHNEPIRPPHAMRQPAVIGDCKVARFMYLMLFYASVKLLLQYIYYLFCSSYDERNTDLPSLYDLDLTFAFLVNSNSIRRNIINPYKHTYI